MTDGGAPTCRQTLFFDVTPGGRGRQWKLPEGRNHAPAESEEGPAVTIITAVFVG